MSVTMLNNVLVSEGYESAMREGGGSEGVKYITVTYLAQGLHRIRLVFVQVNLFYLEKIL